MHRQGLDNDGEPASLILNLVRMLPTASDHLAGNAAAVGNALIAPTVAVSVAVGGH